MYDPNFGTITDVITPIRCQLCGAGYRGGATWPGKKMKSGCRVFYRCGASHSAKLVYPNGGDRAYHMLLKNCGEQDE